MRQHGRVLHDAQPAAQVHADTDRRRSVSDPRGSLTRDLESQAPWVAHAPPPLPFAFLALRRRWCGTKRRASWRSVQPTVPARDNALASAGCFSIRASTVGAEAKVEGGTLLRGCVRPPVLPVCGCSARFVAPAERAYGRARTRQDAGDIVPPQATPQKVQEFEACDRRDLVVPVGGRSAHAGSRGVGASRGPQDRPTTYSPGRLVCPE